MKKRAERIQIGAFGIFEVTDSIKGVNGAWLKDIWETLETLYLKIDWWIGCYNAYDVIRWGQTNRLLTPGEYDKLFNLLQNTNGAK